ncbi:MAG: pitrilysin family protein [candidate division WOR-3 bacterium]
MKRGEREIPEIHATRLPGGMFVITEKLPHFHSVSLGFAYRVGARDDPPDRAGIAHLIEHMIFKGTEELDAKTINIIAESHGAELNGFTDKEGTCFYARFPKDQSRVVVGLMRQILTAPAFAGPELVKEKEVVREEIRAGDEDPESCALNLLFTALFGDGPLGRPAIGTLDSIAPITSRDLSEFYQSHYCAENGVVVAVGAVDHTELVALLSDFGNQKCGQSVRQSSLPGQRSFLVRHRPDISQVHLCLAVPVFSYADSRRYALAVLNTALGGGVSSRLFQRLREEEGLVYSVGSFIELYQDTGLLAVYLSAEQQKLARCIGVLKEELRRLRTDKISRDEFERALVMTRSAVLMGMESPINRMLRLSRAYLILGRVQTWEEIIAAYNQVTWEQVNSLIEELVIEERFYGSAVGPVPEAEMKKVIF